MKIAKLAINTQGGWINDFVKSTSNSSLQTKANTYYSGLYNPFRPNYLSQMSSAFSESPYKVAYNLSTEGYAVNGTKGSNDKGYFILQSGLVSEVDFTTTFPPVPVNYTAPAGCVFDNYKDIWKYTAPTTFYESVFYTYQTATTAYMGYARVGAIATRNDTFLAFTNMNVPHVGVVSVKNLSYITDGRYLRAFNADTNTFSVVDCGVGITLVSVADYGNYVATVGGNGVQTWLFLWDGTSLNLNFKYEIRDTNVTAVVNEGGDLRVFTYGKNETTKIKTFSGTNFSEEADFEVPTAYCTSPTHGMVDVWMNQIVWKASQTISGVTTDGYLWTFGSPRKNEIQNGGHRVGILTTNTTSTGCVKNLYKNNLYIGINNAGVSYLYNVKADESYSSTLNSTIRTALYELPRLSTIEKIQVWFSSYTVPSSSSNGSSLTLKVYRDYEATEVISQSIPTRTDLTTATTINYHPFTLKIPEVDSFYMDINFTACVIRKIVITYSYEDNDL